MRNAIVDRRRFVEANTRFAPVPFVPEILLRQADEAHDIWLKTEAELEAIGLPPPFWAFAWAGGQALARYVLDTPALVAGRRVVDFAAGSGLVAIAARRAGAAEVRAVDVDPFSAAAIAANAEANGQEVTIHAGDIVGAPIEADILLAGDVFYDQAMARRLVPWFEHLAACGVSVVIGDPMRAYRPDAHLALLARYTVPVHHALEDAATKPAAVFAWKNAS